MKVSNAAAARSSRSWLPSGSGTSQGGADSGPSEPPPAPPEEPGPNPTPVPTPYPRTCEMAGKAMVSRGTFIGFGQAVRPALCWMAWEFPELPLPPEALPLGEAVPDLELWPVAAPAVF